MEGKAEIERAKGAAEAIRIENAAVYYSLQGVKVANPAEGNVYIVKKGAKVSKVAF